MDLQQRAVELAKNNSFGVEALEVNLQITRADPANQGAWTRLARCYLEQRRFADAAGALATVLDLNPSNTIAKSLLNEVTKRRAMALPAAEAVSGSARTTSMRSATSRRSKRRARSARRSRRCSCRSTNSAPRRGSWRRETVPDSRGRSCFIATAITRRQTATSMRTITVAAGSRSSKSGFLSGRRVGRQLDSDRTWIQPRIRRPRRSGRRSGTHGPVLRSVPAAARVGVAEPPG